MLSNFDSCGITVGTCDGIDMKLRDGCVDRDLDERAVLN